jgi:protein-tyrosine phosphatase
MKTLIASLILVTGFNTHAAVDGSSISNAHVVTETSQSVVIRGRAPKNVKEFQELLNLGVTEFLIFKNDTKGEVAKEQAQLEKMGVSPDSITHLPFLWKDIHDFKSACTMTIQALQTLEQATQNGRSIYFHCTVGEDRTGYLAGLWGMWTNAYQSSEEALKEEMCARGYEAGNPGKPYQNVVSKIRETLTPTYLKMATIVNEAKKRGQNLDVSLCDNEPTVRVNPSAHYCTR